MRRRDLETESGLTAAERCGAFVVYRDPSSADDSLLSALLPNPDRLFEAGHAIQSPWQSTATDKTVVEIGGKSYFLKRYNCLGSRYRLKSIFRDSRALKSWWAGLKFLGLGVPTSRPLVCMEERRLLMLGRSYLLFELLDGTRSLLESWSGLSGVRRGDFLALLGDEIGRMHRLGLLHGDLNWRNILLRDSSGSPEVFLVDLDGSRFVRTVSKEQAKKDLKHFFRDLQRNLANGDETESFISVWEKAFVWTSVNNTLDD